MNLKSYIEAKGIRQSELARVVNVHPQIMYFWVHSRRPIPIHHCVSIERVTGGLVTRRDLRPDDWWKIWPELVDGAGSRPLCGGGGGGDCSACSDACGGSGGGVCGGDMSEES